MSELARDVTDATFADQVLERSKSVPVLVDLWAPWCGPCRALGPVLERVAADADGAFELVKINVDENPVVAGQLGARSIPLVIAFKDGAPVSSFVGAQPEGAVRKFVAELVPSEADRMVADAQRALERGRQGDAETILRAALQTDPRHVGAGLALAELLGATERVEQALALLDRVEPGPEVDRLRSALRLRNGADDDVEALRERAASGDVEALVQLANQLVAAGDAPTALDMLLASVRADVDAGDGAARQAMLDIFNVLGGADPLVRRYRGLLASALH